MVPEVVEELNQEQPAHDTSSEHLSAPDLFNPH